MKKITLQLKSVANPKQKEKNSVGTTYLNILKQQPGNVKVFKPEIITKLSPPQTESSPKNIPNAPLQKTGRKPLNQIESEKSFHKEENKSTKTIHQPAIYTLNLNVEVEKARFSKENISPAKTIKSPPENKILSNRKNQEPLNTLNNSNLNFFCISHPLKRV